MRFFFVNIGYPPFVGGAQTYVQQLAEGLVGAGHRVTVFTTDAGEVESIWHAGKARLASGSAVVNGVAVKRLPLRRLPPSPYSYYLLRRLTVTLAQAPGTPQRLLGLLAGFTPWAPGLAAALRQEPEPPDLVHCFTIPFEALIKTGADYARGLGTPHVVTPFLHTGGPSDTRVAHGYAMPHQMELLRRASAVVTLTERERAFLLARGVPAGRVHTIPAGIPLPPDCPSFPAERTDHRPLVLFLGAVTYEKGAVHLVEAMRRLWAGGVPVDLALAGTVTDQFRGYLRRLPAADRERVRLRGIVDEDAKRGLLDQCALLAMPSRVDSFGLVYLEAWGHGKPVIGSWAGGVPDVVDHGENGLLVPFGDVTALAAAIRRLLEHPAEAQRLGRAGWKKLHAQYRSELVLARHLELYQRLVQKG